MTNIIKDLQEEYIFIKGEIPVILTAPHVKKYIKKGVCKSKDTNTDLIVKTIQKLTGCHIMYSNKDLDYDPNFDLENAFKTETVKYIKEHNIKYMINIYGLIDSAYSNIEIGTNNLKNLNYDEKILSTVKDILKMYIDNIKIDKRYKATKRTLSCYVNEKTSIKTFQIGIDFSHRNPKKSKRKFDSLIAALTSVVYTLGRSEKIEEINYIERYDDLLNIKSHVETKKYTDISYDKIGLEIEIAVNYDRPSYTFIKNMIIKIQNAVGERGFFVKDATILGDYGFEIVLDPMNVKDIMKIYKKVYKIVQFSKGFLEISKEKKCGIHLNFNKSDIVDLNKSHKLLTTMVVENKKLFEENIYKQFNFIWEYKDYIKYQKEVSGKYIWANYIKKKVVEIRNVNSSITPSELKFLLESSLDALYSDKRKIKKQKVTYDKLDALYSLLLNDKNIITDDVFIISLKNKQPRIIDLDKKDKKEILSKIK